ncbi:xanthine dehydrogenase family protein molybdopterin-binding subunit [candidate division KSB1 bacterium]
MKNNLRIPKRVKTTIEFEGDVFEVDAEVPEDEPIQIPRDKNLNVIHTKVQRIDGIKKVTGKAMYTFDINLPGMLYCKILRSPHAHANIINVDLNNARNYPGVKAVLNLNKEKVRYIGDEIAAVAAETEELAEEAINYIKVEYEKLPFVTGMDKAMQPGAPNVRSDGNISAKPNKRERGDIEEGFKEADVVIERTYRTQVEVHNPAEVHCSVSKWDDDRLTVWDSTQGVHGVRSSLAKALDIPESNIKVICNNMGGGFGGKLALSAHTIVASRLAKLTGVPVKIALTREEESYCVGNRPATLQTIKGGVKKDGTFTAFQYKSYNNGGLGGGGRNASPLWDIYKCPNVFVEEYSVYTNTNAARPMRAPGFPQGTLSLDALIDELAEKIGMDPLKLRMKNYTAKSAGDTGAPYSSKALDKCYELGAERIGWHRRNKKPGEGKRPIKRGIGMATQIWGGAGYPGTQVDFRLLRDGIVEIRCGTQDIGTGTNTIIAQVAAEELGIGIKDIKVMIGDTDYPYSGSSGGSQTAACVCPAIRAAAVDIKGKLFAVAGRLLDVPPERLEIGEYKLFDKNNKSKSISFKEACRNITEGMLTSNNTRGPNPKGYAFSSFGAHFAEVEVNTITGRVKVIRHVAAHEFGRCINILTSENQIDGGTIQGLSYALFEERIMDSQTGRMINSNFHDYKIPTAMDIPKIDPIIIDSVDPVLNNLGMKGLGEPPRIPSHAAMVNAIYNAAGIWIRDLPVTPDKVLAALEKGKEG